MQVELSAREIEIIECLAKGWADSDDMPLYGGLSYQCVIDFLAKIGLKPPQSLMQRIGEMEAMAGAYRRKVSETG